MANIKKFKRMFILFNLLKTDVVAYDYRGYGISKNNFKITEKSIYEDLEFTLSYSIFSLGYSIENIILWGFSLGSGPTVDIASRYQNIGGIILQSPLASVYFWLDQNPDWNFSYYEGDIFCNINKIENIKLI